MLIYSRRRVQLIETAMDAIKAGIGCQAVIPGRGAACQGPLAGKVAPT